MSKSIKGVPRLYVVIWLIFGVYLFWQFRFSLFFPFLVVPFWWLLGIARLGIPKWKRTAIFIIPALTMAICLPTVVLSAAYTNWELKQTLNEFITSAQRGEMPSSFTYDGEPLQTLRREFASDYMILASDYLLGGYDYWVKFSSGVKYHFTMYHEGGAQWSVYAYNYVGKP